MLVLAVRVRWIWNFRNPSSNRLCFCGLTRWNRTRKNKFPSLSSVEDIIERSSTSSVDADRTLAGCNTFSSLKNLKISLYAKNSLVFVQVNSCKYCLRNRSFVRFSTLLKQQGLVQHWSAPGPSLSQCCQTGSNRNPVRPLPNFDDAR